MTTLREAAQAVVDRWNTAYWHDQAETDHCISTLQLALEQPEREPAIVQNLDPLAVFAIEVEMGAWHPDEMAERAAIALKQSKWEVPVSVIVQPEQVATSDEWLANCLQSVCDLASNIKAESKGARHESEPSDREALIDFVNEQSIRPNNIGDKLLFRAVADMLEADAQQYSSRLGDDAPELTDEQRAFTNAQQVAVPQEPNNNEVICPSCCTQFRAIPVNVQHLMLEAGFEPPFKAAPHPPQGEKP